MKKILTILLLFSLALASGLITCFFCLLVFWLCLVFVKACGLLVAVHRLLYLQHAGFSCGWITGCRVLGLRSHGSWA